MLIDVIDHLLGDALTRMAENLPEFILSRDYLLEIVSGHVTSPKYAFSGCFAPLQPESYTFVRDETLYWSDSAASLFSPFFSPLPPLNAGMRKTGARTVVTTVITMATPNTS